MKKAAFAALLLVLVPLQAAALDNDELLGLVAMPLAVAAVSDVAGVPVGDLSHLVTTLNRAEVRPTQVVQVIRYAPAVLVVQEQQPTFVRYVDQQYDRGIRGTQLVSLIEDRYRTYDLEPEFVTLREPATTYVVRDDYIPPAVVTRVSQFQPAYPSYPAYRVGDTNDLLSLIAMPLAVAAVSNLSGIPLQDLGSLVASLNAARMPPLQVVEVLRYAPVALISDYGQPRFVPYIRTQVISGVQGPALIQVIDQRLRTYDIQPQFDVIRREPDVRYVYDDYFDNDGYRDQYFPPVVRTRVAEVRTHPHGGPPGQLKKELGLQTGAEVVHGTMPGGNARERASARRDENVRRPGAERHERVVERVVPRDHPRTVRQEKPKKQRREISSPAAKRDGEWKKPDRRKTDRPRVEKKRTKVSGGERTRMQRSTPAAAKKMRSDGAKARPHGRSEQAKGNGKGKGKGKG